MTRSNEDICLICQSDPATKKNSHWVPATIIDPCVGKRNYEESFNIDFTNGGIETFFGRSNTKNNEHGLQLEKKKHHYMHDFIFCPTCESKLGDLEGKVSPHLMNEFRNNTASYNSKKSKYGIDFRELKGLRDDEFMVFVASIIFRYDISFRISHQTKLLPDEEVEMLRSILHEFIYENKLKSSKKASKHFYFNLITKDHFKEKDPTFILTSNTWDYPNIIYMCQYIILWFSEDDADKTKPSPFQNIVNRIGDTPNCIIINDQIWAWMISQVEIFKDDFLVKVGENITKLNGKSIEENIAEFQELVSKLTNEDKEKLDLNYSRKAIVKLIEKYGKEQ